MVFERGRLWAVYVSDDQVAYAVRELDVYIDQVERGWTTAGVNGLVPLPRGWLPRRVFGVDADGNRRTALVASLGAALWTGVTTAFQVIGSDLQLHEVTVVGRAMERQRRPPPV